MELTSHHQPEEFKKSQKGTPGALPPPRTHPAIHLGRVTSEPPGRTLRQNDWPETIWEHEPGSHAAEQSSWVPAPCCSPPGRPFPVKPLALSISVCPQIINFPPLDKSSLWSPGRAPTSCNRWAQRGNIYLDKRHLTSPGLTHIDVKRSVWG